MRAFAIADPVAMIFGLQDEIGRSKEFRYDHRLHSVLVVLTLHFHFEQLLITS